MSFSAADINEAMMFTEHLNSIDTLIQQYLNILNSTVVPYETKQEAARARFSEVGALYKSAISKIDSKYIDMPHTQIQKKNLEKNWKDLTEVSLRYLSETIK